MGVLFGLSSGPVPPFDIGVLALKGSLFVTRPTLFDYTAEVGDLDHSAAELFDVVQKKVVKIEINQTYPMSEAARAHQDLEARKTTGSTILLP
jgi:NADPH2:quinone reductase